MVVGKEMAPRSSHLPRPGPRKLLEVAVIERSLAHDAHPVVPEGTHERGTCASCGTTTKTLTAPRANVGHGYTGPMYCLPCNPRFGGDVLDAQWSALERMGS